MGMYDAVEDGGPDLREQLEQFIVNGEDPFERLRVAERKLEDICLEYEEEKARRIAAERSLRMVKVTFADAWVWQGDGTDDPATISVECPVVIPSASLREIVRQRDAHWAAYVGAEAMLRASHERERIVQQHRADACDRERQLHDVLRVMEQDLARAVSFLTNDFDEKTSARIFKLLEQDRKRLLAGTERMRAAEERVEVLEEELYQLRVRTDELEKAR